MITNALAIIMFIFALISGVANIYASKKLAEHIGYKDGALTLFHVTQFSVVSFGKIDYQLDDEKSVMLFNKLRKTIVYSYIIFFPLSFITFVFHALEL